MKVNLEDLKKLREQTGAGVGDCRAALEEAGGDLDKAIKSLSNLALKKAEKKSDREVKAGRVFSYVHHTGRVASIVAIACETDFVAKNEEFAILGKELVLQAAATKPANVKEFLAQEYIRDASKTVNDVVKAVIGKLGENMQVVEVKVVEI